jgi:GAF domain-containing protein
VRGAVRSPERTDDDTTIAFAHTFVDVVRDLCSASGVDATLTGVVELAVATIEGCEYAGIFIRQGGVGSATTSTDAVVVDLDALQHMRGEGPCLDAIAQGRVVSADELGTDPRWPEFGPRAAAIGIRSVLALPLVTDGPFGVLGLFSRSPRAFGVLDHGRSLLLASIATFALSSAQNLEDQDRRTVNLQAALVTRQMIGQAEGILIERERLTPDQAFHVLRRASQRLNLKLRDVAQRLVETGERPDSGPCAASDGPPVVERGGVRGGLAERYALARGAPTTDAEHGTQA